MSSAGFVRSCVGVVVGMAAFGPAVAQGALIGQWRLNESSGNAIDSSGSGFTGTATAAGLTYAQASVPAGTYGAITLSAADAAAFGTSVQFTKSLAGRFDLGAPAAIEGLAEGGSPGVGAFSVMAWVYTDSLPAGTTYRVFSTGRPGGWGLGVANVDRVRFTTYGVSDFTSSGTYPFNGNWHHLAATWQDGTLTTYVDGNVAAVTAGGSPVNFVDETGTSFSIGGTDATTNEWFNGRIDEVKLFSTALTQAEVVAAAVPTAVPEPASAGIVVVGAVASRLLRRRRRANAQ